MILYLFLATLWFGLLTMRVASAWAVGAFELAIFALAAAALIRRKFALRPHPVAILLGTAAFWGVLQLSLGLSVDPDRTQKAVLEWVLRCAAFSLGLALTQTRAAQKLFLRAQLFFGLALSVAALIGLFTVSALGPFAYKNQFAAYIETVLVIALAAAVRDRPRSAIWLAGAAALFASVVAAGSRAGAALCLAELILLPLIALGRGWISRRTFLRLAAVSLVSGIVLVEIAGWQTIWKRFQEPNPYSLRADLLRSSLAMTRGRPLLGFGLGTWSSAYPAYARYDDGSFVNEAHNDWAQWAVEGGLPFLLLMGAVAALLLRPAFDSLWGIGLLAVFAHAFVDYPFEQRPALAAFFFAMAGVLAAAAKLESISLSAADRRSESFRAAAPSGN